MRLHELEIENFRIIRSAQILLPDTLIGIIGPNGSGKSSLIEAISWALYGSQAARSGREEIRSSFARPREACVVRLRFSLRDDSFQITRRLTGKVATPQVEVLRNGEPESTGTAETRGYMTGLLGLDWRGFLTSFLARQQELNALSDLQPARRRDHLAGMLGIERLDRALAKLRDDLKIGTEKLSIYSQQMESASSVTEELRLAREHERVGETARGEISGAWTKIEAAFREHGRILREHEALYEGRMERQHRLDSLAAVQAAILQQLDAQKRQLVELESARHELLGLEPQLARGPELELRLNQLGESKVLVGAKLRLEREIESLAGQLQSAETRRTELANVYQGLTAEVSRFPEDLAVQILHRRTQESALNEELGRAKGEREAAVKEASRISAQVAGILKLGPGAMCDRCLRPFGDDFESIRDHLDHELEAATAHVEARAAEVRELTESHVGLVEERTTLERLEARLVEVRRSIGELSVRLDAEDKTIVQTQRRLKELRKELSPLLSLQFDENAYSRLNAEYRAVQQAREQHARLSGLLGTGPALEESVRSLEGQVAELAQQAAEIKNEMDALQYDEAAHAAAATKLEDLAQQRDAQRTELAQAERELELARQRVELLAKQEADFASARAAMSLTQDEQLYGEKLVALLAGFRQRLIHRIRPRLAELTSQLMQDMTAGKYPLVDLDEEYNIRIYDSGQYFGIERFSGGEKDLANLALRLAISLALTESAGLDRSCIILDEVLASQDEIRRELILQGLVHLKHRFPQILLISHINEIKDRVETAIEVVPTEQGWSEVRVVGT